MPQALDEVLGRELNRLGVSPGEADVLTVLYVADDRSLAPTDLARWLGLTTAGLTARLNALESRELIVRHQHPTDGRRRSVHFTEQGETLAQAVIELKDEAVSGLVEGALSASQAKALIAALDIVIARGSAATRQRLHP